MKAEFKMHVVELEAESGNIKQRNDEYGRDEP